MPKNFRNGPTIKALSLETILLAIKFGLIVNILKPNKIKS